MSSAYDVRFEMMIACKRVKSEYEFILHDMYVVIIDFVGLNVSLLNLKIQVFARKTLIRGGEWLPYQGDEATHHQSTCCDSRDCYQPALFC